MIQSFFFFFFFNDTATTEIYTLSLHDALPISLVSGRDSLGPCTRCVHHSMAICSANDTNRRSEEHTSELQSRQYLVCRLLLEKKKLEPYSGTHAAHSRRKASAR